VNKFNPKGETTLALGAGGCGLGSMNSGSSPGIGARNPNTVPCAKDSPLVARSTVGDDPLGTFTVYVTAGANPACVKSSVNGHAGWNTTERPPEHGSTKNEPVTGTVFEPENAIEVKETETGSTGLLNVKTMRRLISQTWLGATLTDSRRN
jgi:hypothetical protein